MNPQYKRKYSPFNTDFIHWISEVMYSESFNTAMFIIYVWFDILGYNCTSLSSQYDHGRSL